MLQYDLEIEQGGTFTLPLVWQNSSKQAIDITGRSARMHVRASHDSSVILVELTDANSRITLGGVAGTIVPKLTAEETATITWISAVYDLELFYDDSGVEVVDKIIRGNITVIPEVTRVQDVTELTPITFITANTNMGVFG